MTEVRALSDNSRAAASEVRILPEIIANKIAAGEVVERPASVVKELIENSLDAGARHISIEIQKGGSDLIRISDDGGGMSYENAMLSIERFATSKIIEDDDLFSIKTFGFRGEALPSIASVSKFSLVTRDDSSPSATKIDIIGGKVIDVSETGAPVGTMIEVKNLYFNTPARRKFLKTVNTEMGHIADAVSAFALASPHVQFRLVHNGRNVKHFSESDTLLSRVEMVLGMDNVNDLYSVDSEEREGSTDRGLYITGYITKPSVSRNSSNNILLFVNRRMISDRSLVSAILKGYKGRLMKGQFPMAALFIKIPFDEVDVNVHPAKLQVRFANQSLVFGAVINAVHNALYNGEKHHDEQEYGEQNGSQKHHIEKMDHNFNRHISEIHEQLLLHEPINTNFDIQKPVAGMSFKSPIGLSNDPFYNTTPIQSASPDPDLILTSADEKQRRDIKSESTETWHSEHAKSERVNGFRIIGQFANTYIIAESKDEMVIIDQHAAHERVVYERLKKRSEGFKPPSQNLIVPEIVEFNYKEAALIERVIPQLFNVGIEIEPFGGTSFVVKYVPAILGDKSIKDILRDIVGMLMVEVPKDETAKIDKNIWFDEVNVWLDKILILMACHSAVRAKHPLKLREMEQLLAELYKCDNPYHCPHGRPTIIYFGEKELEKRFKRIV